MLAGRFPVLVRWGRNWSAMTVVAGAIDPWTFRAVVLPLAAATVSVAFTRPFWTRLLSLRWLAERATPCRLAALVVGGQALATLGPARR
ncbi:MAG: hypothetical protein ACLFU0_05885 [Alphaproteobacteria bacterium]